MGQPNSVQHTTSATTDERPANMAEQKIAPGLRGRESHCTHNCGGGDGCGDCGSSCGVGGVEGAPQLIELIANQFNYNDSRRIIEVEFRGARREFIQVDDQTPLKVRDLAVVQTERGVDAGYVSMVGSLVHIKRKAKKLAGEPLPTLIRKGDASDVERYASNRKQEKEALTLCRSRVEFFQLPMELVDAEWQFDHHRITFFFLADGRVDFRELVRDLAAVFHTRIELRQIPLRDEAKRLGTVGICGLQLCCASHLGRYEHITLDHARAQHLQPNPAKLSGQCGRLKCCLLYEVDHYVEALKRFPTIESTVKTHKGEGVLHKIDIFRDQLVIHHPDGWETITLADFIEQQTTPPPPPTLANGAHQKQDAAASGKGEQKRHEQKGGKEREKEARRQPQQGESKQRPQHAAQPKSGTENREKPQQQVGRGQRPQPPADQQWPASSQPRPNQQQQHSGRPKGDQKHQKPAMLIRPQPQGKQPDGANRGNTPPPRVAEPEAEPTA
ncbi:MAG: hypothetical protein IT211_05000 [Armatimonadetes bacterium]|nr:hypothetical protein [Armatimonadota bacterium]